MFKLFSNASTNPVSGLTDSSPPPFSFVSKTDKSSHPPEFNVDTYLQGVDRNDKDAMIQVLTVALKELEKDLRMVKNPTVDDFETLPEWHLHLQTEKDTSLDLLSFNQLKERLETLEKTLTSDHFFKIAIVRHEFEIRKQKKRSQTM
eukprot:Lithocolla_globosa_v1_NODE_4413_length_1440_cov_7.815162.p1 type:complete len:147 gc:universal NODE_4413_length_1440_cov_7.815162:526-86(-)